MIARRDIERTMLHAKELRDVAVNRDLRACMDALDRTIRHAAQTRQRLLRQAGRKEGEAAHVAR